MVQTLSKVRNKLGSTTSTPISFDPHRRPEREVTPPPGFSTLTPLPVTDVNNLLPITASTFTIQSHPETTPYHHASTSANSEPVISPAFVEANYEELESLLRARRRQVRNTEMIRELEYSSDKSAEEMEMEPRPSAPGVTHPILRIRSSTGRRTGGRSVGFEGVPERPLTRREGTVTEGSNGRSQQREASEVNLPPLLAAHLGRTEAGVPLQPSHASGVGGHPSSFNMGRSLPPNGMYPPFQTPNYPQNPYPPTNIQANNHQFPQTTMPYGQTMVYPSYTMHNGYPVNIGTPYPPYPNQTPSRMPPPHNPYNVVPTNMRPYHCLYPEPTGPTTPFVRWIEDYLLPDGLKMPSHIGTYDGKGDPDNFIHLFDGAVRMQKWVMPVACHMFTYTLRDSARIWWNGQRPGSIINLDDLKAKFRSHFSQQKKFTRTHLTVHNIKQKENENTRSFVTRTYTWIEAKEVSTNGAPIDSKEQTHKFPNNSSWEGSRNRNKNQHRFTPYSKTPNHGLIENLSKSPKEILTTEKVAKTFEPPPHFGHETNSCRELKRQIEEAVKSGQLAHLVKGIKKGKERVTDAPLERDPYPTETPILIVRRAGVNQKRKEVEEEARAIEEIAFPPMTNQPASDDPVVIKVLISNREVSRAYMDCGSSCEIIYEHYFLKHRPSIRSKRVDSKIPLVGFSGEHSWPLGEVPLEVTIGEGRENSHAEMGIVVSTIHAAIKFQTAYGIGTVLSSYKRKTQDTGKKIKGSPQDPPKVILSCGDAEERIIINELYPEQMMVIGKQLPIAFKAKLEKLLRDNKDVFAWAYSDMTEVPRNLMIDGKPFGTEHKLNEYKHIEPIKQKRRSLAPERNAAACKEVDELVQAGILREVKYQTWVANPVMVKKSDGGWCMCVDFTDINKACPKDCYPLPEIDWKVESLSGFRLKCFLDAYKGYHQIQMAVENEEKTAFYTGKGVYCYKKMPFGLRNAGATYQRLVDKAFNKQIGRNLEAYVDDMVIKSRTEEELLSDNQETFDQLRAINMKLNPKKCSFGVEEGQFLGHLITKQGIKANPSKVKAITDLQAPKTLKEVQSLNGKLAALSRFLSKGADRSLPFFETFKGCMDKKTFQWSEEAEAAFQKLKEFMEILLTLTAPIKGEMMYMYIATSYESISAVLLAEREKKQIPIYFVSRILSKPEKSGRIAKWAIELGEHEIEYKGRNSIKGQILADFLAETPYEPGKVAKVSEVKPSKEKEAWKLYTDGASSSNGSGAGLMLVNPEGKEFTYALRFEFDATNNEAEYEALLAGLRLARDMELVANQIKGSYEARQPTIKQYLDKAKELLNGFESYMIEHVRRNQNKKADALSKLASMAFAHLTKEVLVEVLAEREYLISGILPEDPKLARKIRIKSPQYRLIEDNLYRRSFLSHWLRCVGPKQAANIIYEVHEGSCSIRAGPRSIVSKITKLGYYWPSMHRDATDIIHKCEACQIHSNVPRLPKQDMTSVTSAWPFSQWGIDIVGPLPVAPGGVKFLVVAIDYFTKWVEAKPLASVTGRHMEKFVWEHIICRFEVPHIIISDSGKQFAEGVFLTFCKGLKITQSFTSVYHPQGNGQVEVTNRDIINWNRTKTRSKPPRMGRRATTGSLGS
ncbi:reverse transcriptase domain-containing protein [Artemisia annua]|uniref:Reverse transcriptase domain-containing protein n=1 Tax=Artemisia annua TaxID=35608 RepID=A0A2U1NY19_ARTAN|nr:reverse transcriptase domain-containing protein [Artemisia annua]